MEHLIVYVTTSSVDEAREIASVVVEQRLAACANILPGMESVYYWQGNIQNDQEVVLILKTIKAKATELIEAIIELHSYDEPCVITLPIAGGSKSYLDWITRETNPKKK